jgi:hypothetical protein
VIFLLTRKPRYEGLGIPEATYLTRDFDAINDVIFRNHKDDPVDNVRSEAQRIHAEFVKHIEALSEEELMLPYRHYLPDEPREGEGPPVKAVVYADGAPHYRDHQQWMEEQLGLN